MYILGKHGQNIARWKIRKDNWCSKVRRFLQSVKKQSCVECQSGLDRRGDRGLSRNRQGRERDLTVVAREVFGVVVGPVNPNEQLIGQRPSQSSNVWRDHRDPEPGILFET